MTLVIFALNHSEYFRIQLPILTQQRQQAFVRQQKSGAQRHRARAGPRYHPATQAAHFFDPRGELARVADGRGKQQQTNARRRQNDRFFPDVTAIFVAEIMRLIYDDQVGAHVMAAAHSVEQLIAKDFRRADDQRRV